MKISGFTIARNVMKYNYPFVESIRSILPLCDEFVVNLGDSDDGTRQLVESLNEPKVRVVPHVWDFSRGKEVLCEQTNLAMRECRGDWGFYLQADEVVHEADLARLKRVMQRNLDDPSVDALRFFWFHFYGSYYRYRIDSGWYQKQDRIVRLNGAVESYGDAYAFRRKDGRPLNRRNTEAYIYHYGWVQPSDVMGERRLNAERIGFVSLEESERNKAYDYGDLDRFPVYFGRHPAVMQSRVRAHDLSQEDWRRIRQKYWWHPCFLGRIRYKTPRRIKSKIT